MTGLTNMYNVDGDIKEKEMRAKLFEMFEKLDSLPIIRIPIAEKFDIFRSYFNGIVDGFLICAHAVGIEVTLPLSNTEAEVERIINAIEADIMPVETGWQNFRQLIWKMSQEKK